MQRLQDEENQLEEKLASQARDQFRSTTTNPVDLQLIDLDTALAKIPYTNTAARSAVQRQIAACLGEVKYAGDRPDPQADALGATSGATFQKSMVLELSWMQLNNAAISLPVLADWLCGQNCIGIKYDLMPGYSYAEAGNDD